MGYNKKTVYLIGPITGDPRDSEWRDKATVEFKKHGIRILNPLRGDPTCEDARRAGRDYRDIKKANVVLAHFPYIPNRQCVGSFWELGIAHEQGDVIVVASDNELIREHLFVRAFADARFDNLDEAVQYVIKRCE